MMAVTKTFNFSFQDETRERSLTVPIHLPFYGQTADFIERLILAHHLPAYVKSKLEEQLLTFVRQETQRIQDEEAENLLKDFVSTKAVPGANVEDAWVEKYVAEHAACSGSVDQSEEAAFAQVYYSLIHSPALETLLQLEHSYASNVEQEIIEMERSRTKMQERHSAEVERAVANLGTKVTDHDINRLTSKHFEETEMFETQCVSSLGGLVESQRREYRDWVSTVQLDSLDSILARPAKRHHQPRHSRNPSKDLTRSSAPKAPVLEESFTIHLGAQMKSMHNLRLISCDVLDLCRHQPQAGDSGLSPQRLQTAMTLYSASLAGAILLVDNRISSFIGIKKEFAELCKRSTEFHFPALDKQLEVIRETVSPLVQSRTTSDSQLASPNASGSSTPASPSRITPDVQHATEAQFTHMTSSDSKSSSSASTTLRTGDFYVTRHSNLSQVHCVFHLVVDDTVRSNSLSSRQPCLVGLRNVLHHAAVHNVFNISIPLLLSHEMTEEMTLPWCLKRAELVFKCVKGFMMENSSWSGLENRTIQFVLPPGISESVFSQFTAMLPNIFRLANALDLR